MSLHEAVSGIGGRLIYLIKACDDSGMGSKQPLVESSSSMRHQRVEGKMIVHENPFKNHEKLHFGNFSDLGIRLTILPYPSYLHIYAGLFFFSALLFFFFFGFCFASSTKIFYLSSTLVPIDFRKVYISRPPLVPTWNKPWRLQPVEALLPCYLPYFDHAPWIIIGVRVHEINSPSQA